MQSRILLLYSMLHNVDGHDCTKEINVRQINVFKHYAKGIYNINYTGGILYMQNEIIENTKIARLRKIK